MSTVHAFDFLDASDPPTGIECFVLFGDDRFLKLLVRNSLLDRIAGGDSEFDIGILDGETATLTDAVDHLATVSLFSQNNSGRVVVIDDADRFVSEYRGDLEKIVNHSAGTGRLVLLVSTWPGNTRLYKAVDKSGCQIHCGLPQSGKGRNKSPDTAAIGKWITRRADSIHGLTIDETLAKQLLELVEWNLGRADQELAKLALFGNRIDAEMICEVVGGWRAMSVWEAAAAATQGKTDEALAHLDNLLQSGDHPLALFGPLSWSLRRYGRLWEIVSRQKRNGRKQDLSKSLGEAGFRPWSDEMDIAGASVHHLGRHRVRKFYRWLLETDLMLKGTHSDHQRGRFALEKLVFRMATLDATNISRNADRAASKKHG